MARSKGLTPGLLVSKIRENQNNNGTLKSIFSKQFLGKFSLDELEGLIRSINREIERRESEKINELTSFLEDRGYRVTKK